MSLSLSDVLYIIQNIKGKVDTYHSNNSICLELARLCSRSGTFIYTNMNTLNLKLQDCSISAKINEMNIIFLEIETEIDHYEGKGFIKKVFRAQKYDKRFKDLCMRLNDCQQLLQTMLLTNIADNVFDVKEMIDHYDSSNIEIVCDSVIGIFILF